MYWMLLPLRRYADFGGRSRPKEYWMFVLFLMILSVLLTMIDFMLGYGATTSYSASGPAGFWGGWAYVGGGGPLTLLFTLAVLIPSIAVAVRRLHDSDRSGWWILLVFVPVLGMLILLVFMIIGGTRGPNRFGPDPVERPVV